MNTRDHVCACVCACNSIYYMLIQLSVCTIDQQQYYNRSVEWFCGNSHFSAMSDHCTSFIGYFNIYSCLHVCVKVALDLLKKPMLHRMSIDDVLCKKRIKNPMCTVSCSIVEWLSFLMNINLIIDFILIRIVVSLLLRRILSAPWILHSISVAFETNNR